jgi:hypothetical protein
MATSPGSPPSRPVSPDATSSGAVESALARVRDWLPLACAIVALVGVAIAINVRKSIWLDEAFTMNRTFTSLAKTIELARIESQKPPIYFILVYWWRHLWPSLEGVRALSTVCIVVAGLALHGAGVALGVGRGIWSLGVLGILAAHLGWAAAEARPYAMSLMFLSLTMWMFARVWVSGSPHKLRDSVFFVLSCYGALLSFYYSGFVLAALFLSGLFFQDRTRLLVCGIALAALMLPWMLIVSEHATDAGSYMPQVSLDGETPLSALTGTVSWIALHLARAVHRDVPFYQPGWRQVGYLALLLGIVGVRLWQTRGRLPVVERWAVALFVGGFAFVAFMRLTNRHTVDLRHWVIVAIPTLVSSAVLASRIQPLRVARAAQGALLLSSLVGFISLSRNEKGPRDWRSAIQSVMADERPGEPVVISYNPLPVAYYYRGPNTITRIPAITQAKADSLIPEEVDRLRRTLATAGTPEQTFWYIHAIGANYDGAAMIRRFAGETLTTLERREFHGTLVYRMKRGAP